MPIYEYVCDGCAYRFERKQSIKDDPVATCERCGKSVTRLISSPAIMFKGSGWYVTDYSDKLKPPAGSEVAAPAAGEKHSFKFPFDILGNLDIDSNHREVGAGRAPSLVYGRFFLRGSLGSNL